MTTYSRYPSYTIARAFREFGRLCGALLFSACAGAVLIPAIAYTGKRIVDSVLSRSVHDTIEWVCIEMFLAVTTMLVARWSDGARTLLKERLALETTSDIARKLFEFSFAELEERYLSEHISRARRAATDKPGEYVVNALHIIEGVIGLAIYAAILWNFSGWTLLLFATAIPSTAAEMWASKTAFQTQRLQSSSRQRLQYLEDLLLSQEHRSEVWFWGLSGTLMRTLRAVAGKLQAQDKDNWTASNRIVLPATLASPVAIYGCTLIMAISAARGRIGLGDLTMYWAAINMAQRFSQLMLSALRRVSECHLHLRDIGALLAREVTSAPQRPGVPFSERSEIRFENVGFKYPGRSEWTLRGIDLTISPGELAIIVGGNGSGKTTLLKLTTGLYAPTEGRVLIDGIDVASCSIDDLRSRFGVMFQSYERYQFSLRENIGLPGHTSSAPDERLLDALRASDATEFALELPDGLSTELGPSAMGRMELSGGQWQKLALARAIYRDTSKLLILDEPTSAMDPASERHVFECLFRLRNRSTILLTSHRVGMLRHADRVIVLKHGRLVSEGAFDALLHRGALGGFLTANEKPEETLYPDLTTDGVPLPPDANGNQASNRYG